MWYPPSVVVFACVIMSPSAGLALAGQARGAPVVYVDDDAPPGGDGASWAGALSHLQDALAMARTIGGAEIRVARGVYFPDRSAAEPLGSGDRLATFALVDNTELLGGYAGLGAGDPDARDPDAHLSVLTGDLASNDDAAIPDARADNAYHVIESWGNDASAIVDGLVIQGGHADRDFDEGWWPDRRDDSAGGALLVDSDAVLRDCVFVENHGEANASVWVALSGPFAFVEAGSGAVMVAGGSPSIEGCVFERNTANRVGGALGLNRTSARVSRCVFRGNVIGVDPADLTFGGAIGDSSLETGAGRARIDSCWFVGNSAPMGQGGALFSIFSDSVYANCVFVGNHARGGGGAMFADNIATVEFHNCVIAGNTSDVDAAGVQEISSVGDVYLFANCIVWGNRSGEELSPLNENMISLGGNFAIYDTIVEDSSVRAIFTFDASRVLDFDPGFADPVGPDGIGFSGDEDLRLAPGSMAIDAGNSSRLPVWVMTDAVGRARLVDTVTVPDTGVGPAPIVDLGAYEFGPGCAAADLALPFGELNFFDVSAFLDAFNTQDLSVDFTGDGVLNFFDVSVFLLLYNAGCP